MALPVIVTPKQEKFCQLYIQLGNATEAYSRAYGEGAKSTNAGKLLINEKIKARIAELHKMSENEHSITVKQILQELEEARDVAKNAEKPQPSAMVAATMGKAKVAGLLVEKQEVTGLNGGPIQHQVEAIVSNANELRNKMRK